MIIYKVTNKLNDKIYIGKTMQSLSKRKASHYKKIKYKSNTNFHRALRKYPKNVFLWEIEKECKNEIELNESEIYFINKYDAYKTGYNMTLGGDGGTTFKNGDNLYKKIKHKLSNWKNGNPGATPEAIAKRIETFKKTKWVSGKYHGNYGHKHNIGILVGEKNPMFGKTPTNARKVKINGVDYNSIKHASRELNLSEPTIRKRCLDKNNINYEFL